MVSRGNSRQLDKYLWWPSLFVFIPPAAFTLILAIPNSSFFAALFAAPFLILIMAIAAVWASSISIISFRQKAWRKALSAVLLPGVLVLYLLNWSSLASLSADLGEELNFHIMYPYYQSRVASLSEKKGQRLAVFVLNGWGPIANGIAFDDSGEIALPVGSRSVAWKARATGTELSTNCWSALHTQGYFYRWSFVNC